MLNSPASNNRECVQIPGSRQQLQGLLGHHSVFGLGNDKEMRFDVFYSLMQCIAELVKILFVKENLVLLVFLFPDALALGNRNIEILFGFRRLDVEKVRALTCPHAFGEDFVLVVVFQGDSLPE